MKVRFAHEKESQIEVRDRGPREDELNGIVDELDLQRKLSEEVLTRRPDSPEEYSGVYSREEGTVQPAATLRDELRDLHGL